MIPGSESSAGTIDFITACQQGYCRIGHNLASSSKPRSLMQIALRLPHIANAGPNIWRFLPSYLQNLAREKCSACTACAAQQPSNILNMLVCCVAYAARCKYTNSNADFDKDFLLDGIRQSAFLVTSDSESSILRHIATMD